MYGPAMRLVLLARHGQSLFNADGVVNGDPALDRGLSPLGLDEARDLGRQIAGVAIDLCVVSAFPRAQQTAQLALAGHDAVPWEVDPELNDVRIGALEGDTLEDYRTWKHAHTRADHFPGGESLNDAARRYAGAYERLLRRPENTILCVCHEIPVRYAVNAAAGSDDLDGPFHHVANATPYVFDADGLSRAVERLARS
jgi:broad specificity phosphatase PhoE